MKKQILFLSVFGFVSTVTANPFTVPNDLSMLYKGAKGLPSSTIEFKEHTLSVKEDPHYKKPILVFDIPSSLSQNEVLDGVVLPDLGLDFSYALVSDENGMKTYQLSYRQKEVRGSVVRYACAGNSCAMGLWLPKVNLKPYRFAIRRLAKGLMLVEGKLTEYAERVVANGKRITFPIRAQLQAKSVVELEAKASQTGAVEPIKLPTGTFPDQIKFDSHGVVWFSQPSNNMITSYDPQAKTWFHKTVGPAPDGLFVDHNDYVWFGEYSGSALGFYNPAKDSYKNYPMPYTPSNPAVPFEDNKGDIWFSDHQNNRLNKFLTATSEIKSYVVPTSGSWTVDIVQTDEKQYVYFTECYANKIGRFEPGTEQFNEVPLSTNSCPAFFVPTGNALWISLWSAGEFMKLDTSTGEITEYKIKDEKSGFGPIAKLQNGKIVIGHLNSKRVYLFDPTTQELIYVTGVGSLKDGMAVDSKGAVWVTGMEGILYRATF